jgi:DNA-binding IclR family transcriptional regulator
VAAISVAGPSQRILERHEFLAGLLVEAAAELEGAMAGTPDR